MYTFSVHSHFLWIDFRAFFIFPEQLPQGRLKLIKEDFIGPIPTQLMVYPNDYQLQVVWAVFLLSFGYFLASCVNCRNVMAHAVAMLKSVSCLLDHRRHLQGRRNQRHVAALAALPSPKTRSSVSASTDSPHPHAD